MGKGLKEKKLKVYIFAYTEVNVGDDLFIHQLIKRYPDVQFIMIADELYKSMLSIYDNIHVYNKQSLYLKVLKKFGIYMRWEKKIIHSCSYAVYIGGSVFMEYEQWKEQYLWYKNLFENNKMFFIGCNWGPCKTDSFYNNMRIVLKNMRDVCFRDKKSYNLFSDLGNVRYAPDILFGTKFKSKKIKNQVLVSVINCSSKEEGGDTLGKYEKNYLCNLNILISFYLEKGFEIKLVSFCEKEKDSWAINKIKGMFGENCKDRISELFYNGYNLNEILSEIGNSALVIASRFHAVILGMVADIPVIPIIYSSKTLNVLEDMGYEGEYVDIRKYDRIEKQCLNDYIENWKRPRMISDWIEESNIHFQVLDNALNNK